LKKHGKFMGLGYLTLGLILACFAGCTQSIERESGNQQIEQKLDHHKEVSPLQNKKNQRTKRQQGQSSQQGKLPPAFGGTVGLDPLLLGSELLGCPTDHSLIINVVPHQELEVFFEYGTAPGVYTMNTKTHSVSAQTPVEVVMDNLQPDKRYYYRMRYCAPGDSDFQARDEFSFHTQRSPGSTFTFALQGDSHPERAHQNDPKLYARTLQNAAVDRPDFYLTIGDDFSIDTLKSVTPETITQMYVNQRRYLGIVGNSAPVFLINGNHEQGAAYLLDGTPNNPAVWVQNARNRYYPQPAPDEFYSGDAQPVDHIGLLRDYYAWEWGDALFVVIDPYWHSTVPVDNRLDGGDKVEDKWDISLGDVQYQWLKKTLGESEATFTFVFTHQVLGTGRGGIGLADLYEWGGKSRNGTWEFGTKRPDWELPIHQLMVQHGVTVFFHGHDHLFAKEELDGVIYQELPLPADPAYTLYNANAYPTGMTFPNSGHVRVTVSASKVQVNYVRAWLPEDQTNGHLNGEVAYSYTIEAKR